jgi:hypothetical protein
MIHNLKSIEEVMDAFERVHSNMPEDAKGILSGYRWFNIWLINHDTRLSDLATRFEPCADSHDAFYNRVRVRMDALKES